MNLLIIKGSYHKKGFISSLVEEIVKGYKLNSKNSVEIIDLLDANIEFCGGCKQCAKDDFSKKIGKCCIKDEMNEILEKMLKADALILASPVYHGGVTALMKRFVERTFPLCTYKDESFPGYRLKRNKNKLGYVVLSTDCPAPLNRISMLTLYPLILLKSILKLSQCGKVNTFAASTYKGEKSLKKAYKIGVDLTKV